MKTFTEFTTITGRTIKVNSNVSKRHFTIKTESGTYRTSPMSKEEFEEHEYNTGNDWQHFLNSDNSYKIR